MPSRLRLDRQLLLAVGLWILVALTFVHAFHSAFRNEFVGFDFDPLRHAGQALRDGKSVYSDKAFVYPPTAAPALLPLTLGSRSAALHAWIFIEMIAMGLGIIIAARATGSPRWILFAPVIVGILFGGPIGISLFLANLSVLLTLAAVGVVVFYERGQWTAGTALLVVCLLLKPLLAPLLLLPLLARQWKALATTIIPGALVLTLAMIVVPGGGDLPKVIRFLLKGSALQGRNADANLSLRGLAQTHDSDLLNVSVWLARLITIAVIIWCLYVWTRSTRTPGATAAVGGLVMAGIFLCGSLSEVHFLFLLFGITLVGIQRTHRGAIGLYVFALLLAAAPDYRLSFGFEQNHAIQVRFILIEFLLLAACVIAITSQGKAGEAVAGLTARRPRSAERAHP